jgi:AcrR family transcriptional regulator
MAAPAPIRKRLRPSARRELILAGAGDVFAHEGYHHATVAAIARAGGVSPAVVYDHFPSKAALAIELLERHTQELLAFVAAALMPAPPEPEAQLRAGIDAFFCFVQEHPAAWRTMFREPPSDPEVAAAHLHLERTATAAIAGMLARGQDIDQSTKMFAELLKSAQNGLARWWFEHPEVPREQVVERVMQFCWYGLALQVPA